MNHSTFLNLTLLSLLSSPLFAINPSGYSTDYWEWSDRELDTFYPWQEEYYQEKDTYLSEDISDVPEAEGVGWVGWIAPSGENTEHKEPYATINLESKYYTIGKELAKLIIKGYKAQDRYEQEKAALIQERIREINNLELLNKLAENLSSKSDIISKAQLATFLHGLCSKLEVKDIHHLRDYMPLYKNLRLSTRSIGDEELPFSDLLIGFLERKQLGVLGYIYYYALTA